jgi:hypothetical protein
MTNAIRTTPVMATIIFLPTEDRKNEESALTAWKLQLSGRWIAESRSRVFRVKLPGDGAQSWRIDDLVTAASIAANYERAAPGRPPL